MATKKAQGKDWADRLWEQFKKQPPQITDEQLDGIERSFQRDRGVTRRFALASLSQSGAQLLAAVPPDGDRETAAAFADAMLSIEEYAKRLESLADLMKSASTRMGMALANRPDMKRLLAEAHALRAAA